MNYSTRACTFAHFWTLSMLAVPAIACLKCMLLIAGPNLDVAIAAPE